MPETITSQAVVKERPMLFSGPMVRALLDGRKTQTRRIVKPMPKWADQFPICKPDGMAAGHEIWWWDGEFDRVGVAQDCPYGKPGDRLWVKERLARSPDLWTYVADGAEVGWPARQALASKRLDYSPSIHMPKAASRLTLEIADVRVERLQDISYDDCAAEGTTCPIHGDRKHTACSGLREGYRTLWESINGAGSWAANPWVWAVSFRASKSESPNV